MNAVINYYQTIYVSRFSFCIWNNWNFRENGVKHLEHNLYLRCKYLCYIITILPVLNNEW